MDKSYDVKSKDLAGDSMIPFENNIFLSILQIHMYLNGTVFELDDYISSNISKYFSKKFKNG